MIGDVIALAGSDSSAGVVVVVVVLVVVVDVFVVVVVELLPERYEVSTQDVYPEPRISVIAIGLDNLVEKLA